eukprot:COSAG04_NODE_19723_length_409_cov_1.329032_1_plen_39_part_01
MGGADAAEILAYAKVRARENPSAGAPAAAPAPLTRRLSS